MLEHADGIHRVERFVDIAVILQAYLDRQAGAQRARKFGLFLRDGDADTFDAIVFCGVLQCFTPAAADVEYALPRFELQLAADQIELGGLRVVEVSACAQ